MRRAEAALVRPRARATPPRARPAPRAWVAVALAALGPVPGAAALAVYGSPLVELVTRPRTSAPQAALVDRYFRRRDQPSAVTDGRAVDERGDWVFAETLRARQDIVRCLTASGGCAFADRPVAERAFACAPEPSSFCDAPRARVRVCRLFPATTAPGSVPPCAAGVPSPVWLLFTNRDLGESAADLERSCAEELQRWCAWRPREVAPRRTPATGRDP